MKTFVILFRRCGSLVLFAAIQFGCPLPPAVAADQAAQTDSPPWARHYKEGEKIVYHMKATNRGPAGTRIYEFEANGVVRKGPEGKFYEEFAWTNLVSDNTTNKIDLFSLPGPSAWSNLIVNKKALVLPPASVNFRQQLVLPSVAQASDFVKVFSSMPDFGKLHPAMIGPVADLMTFYADLITVSRFGGRAKAGDHCYVNSGGRGGSWADGTHVVLGEDSFDFDCTVREIDRTNQTATLLIKHVPSEKPQFKLPAEWMRVPVADTTNNWVQVEKNKNGTYAAGVGKETFEVQIKVSLVDGRILSARMDNPVEVLERECTDATLTTCGNPIRYQIRRQIEVY
ncbi:MAG: hypothetical protein ABSH21_01570 [Verrucomicrobiia bacterium]|jgi:hypothetical protein